MAQLKVTQVKSTIGNQAEPAGQHAHPRTEGHPSVRRREDNAQNRGLINVVRHLVTVEEV